MKEWSCNSRRNDFSKQSDTEKLNNIYKDVSVKCANAPKAPKRRIEGAQKETKIQAGVAAELKFSLHV